MLSFKGIDNAAYYRLVRDNRRYYMDYTGTGNTLNMRHPHVLQLHHGQPALLGDRDARRRLPLRPRRDAGARAARRRSAVGVLRSDPAGSDRQPGEADRRAVGRRRGRLPGRQLPAAVVGVERQVSRLGARLLARHRSDAGRVRLALHRQLGSLPGHGAAALRQHQLHHRARRLHAARSRRRTTTSTTRPTARRTATARTTTARGTAASRGRPTTRRSSRCATARCATSSRRCSCRRACRCSAAATRSAARSGGNNNAYCQDNEISWYDWEQRRPALLQFTARSDRLRTEHPVFCRRRWFQGRADPRQRGQRHRLVHARRHRDVGRRTGRPASPSRSACSSTATRIPTRDERGERVVDDSFYVMFNAHSEPLGVRRCRRRSGASGGRSRSTPASRRSPGLRTRRPQPCGGRAPARRRAGRSSCCARLDAKR